MHAQIAEADVGRGRVNNGVASRTRKQYLPAVGGGADPSRRVHRDAHVTRIGQGGTPGVDSDSDPYLHVVRPNLLEHSALNAQRGIEGSRRLLEAAQHPVGW